MNGRTYDISAFKNSIDIREVLGHFGYGTAINRNIKCPGNEHEDNKPSARIYLDKNICKCFSCDNRFSTIDIVMKNAEVETWQEACDYMIENFDCKGFYTDKNKENEEQEKFPLTRQEILDLGLSPKSMFVENPFKPDEKIRMDLYLLWKDDREAFNEMIGGKTFEAIDYFKDRIKQAEKDIQLCQVHQDFYIEKSESGLTIDELVADYKADFEKYTPNDDPEKNSYEIKALQMYYKIDEIKTLTIPLLQETLNHMIELNKIYGKYYSEIEQDKIEDEKDDR